MAGFRLTLKKLAKKYGVDIEGSTYRQVVEEIVKDNVNRASKKMGEISNRRYKQAFQDSIDDGIIQLPEYAVPAVTVRKASQDGKMITDTLRDTLVRDLRKAITDNPNDTEKAIAQMAQSVSDNMKQYQNVHSKVIAVTEVRSAVDLSKYEYAKELMNRNQGRLKVTKKWIHNDHLVKIPRPTHKAIDGEIVPFEQNFSIGLAYPHDPNAKAEDVIGCQCGYQIEVEEMATNQIFKELKEGIKVYKDIQAEKIMKASKASINPATGKPYQIGETKTRPDGTKWIKTGTYSWAKAGTADAEEAQKKDTNKDGVVDDKDKKPASKKGMNADGRYDGQSTEDAYAIIDKIGDKSKDNGLSRLTKAGLANLLLENGVEDPMSMKWNDKVAKFKEIVAKRQTENKTKREEKINATTDKFTDFRILHNKGFVLTDGQVDSDAKVFGAVTKINVPIENGEIQVELGEDGTITDKSYDDLYKAVNPIRGGHWGSASTSNRIARAVAMVNSPEWKPINQMKDGSLQQHQQSMSLSQYQDALVKGVGLRKYAQEQIKNREQMSRENCPNFYRGMSISIEEFDKILAGEADTIELTGCTAFSCFEKIADQYGSSSWTRSFGANKKAIKIVLERDDYVDNSIGMFHDAWGHSNIAKGREQQAFELLSGAPALKIMEVVKPEVGDHIKTIKSNITKNQKQVESLTGAKNSKYDPIYENDNKVHEAFGSYDSDPQQEAIHGAVDRMWSKYYSYSSQNNDGWELLQFSKNLEIVTRGRPNHHVDFNAILDNWDEGMKTLKDHLATKDESALKLLEDIKPTLEELRKQYNDPKFSINAYRKYKDTRSKVAPYDKIEETKKEFDKAVYNTPESRQKYKDLISDLQNAQGKWEEDMSKKYNMTSYLKPYRMDKDDQHEYFAWSNALDIIKNPLSSYYGSDEIAKQIFDRFRDKNPEVIDRTEELMDLTSSGGYNLGNYQKYLGYKKTVELASKALKGADLFKGKDIGDAIGTKNAISNFLSGRLDSPYKIVPDEEDKALVKKLGFEDKTDDELSNAIEYLSYVHHNNKPLVLKCVAGRGKKVIAGDQTNETEEIKNDD